MVEKFYKPKKFVTFLGFEWTSELYGHKNVYYRENYNPLYNWWDTTSDSPKKLWKLLRKLKTDVITIPHHPPRMEHMTNWDYHDEILQPLVEIYSQWGNHEYYGAPLQKTENTLPGLFVQDALAKDLKLGFVGGSDAHLTMGGTSGLTAIYAKNLDRNSIWDALINRRVYATTGARIKLDFSLNGFPMGSVINVDQYSINNLFPLHIMVAVDCTDTIDRIEVIQNNQIVHKFDCWRQFGKKAGFAFKVPYNYEYSGEKAEWLSNFSRYYYIRVIQCDKHIAWSSPIWIDFRMNETE